MNITEYKKYSVMITQIFLLFMLVYKLQYNKTYSRIPLIPEADTPQILIFWKLRKPVACLNDSA